MFHQAKVVRNQRNRLCLVGIVLALFAAQQPFAPANAQETQYRQLTVDVKEGDARFAKLKRQKQSVVNGASPLASNRAEMDEWYKSFFNSFVQIDELGKLSAKRLEVVKDLKSAGRSAAMHDYLLNKTWTYMQVFATGQSNGKPFPVHPVVRFNAMLLIGDLNKEEVGTGTKFPVPHTDLTFDFMLGEFENPDQIDAVKVAALLGILRHARLDWAKTTIAGNSRRTAADLMLKLVQAEVPEGRDPAAHLWMRRRGVETLAALKTIGSSVEEATAAVVSLISNPDEDIMLRCTAASALQLYDEKGKRLDLTETARQLGVLAVAASKSELDWISEYKRKKATEEEPEGMSIAAFTGMMAGSGASAVEADEAANMMGVEVVTADAADDQSTGWEGLTGAAVATEASAPEVILAQRRILTKLVAIRRGMDKMVAAAEKGTPQEKQKVGEFSDQLKAILESTVPSEAEGLDSLARRFGKAVRAMGHLAKAPAALAKPAGDATAAAR